MLPAGDGQVRGNLENRGKKLIYAIKISENTDTSQ